MSDTPSALSERLFLGSSDLRSLDLPLVRPCPSDPPSARKICLSPTPVVAPSPETNFAVKSLPKAYVPIIKLSLLPSPGLPFGIACDIGFENRLALENTRLLLTYATVDPARVRTMVLFVKVWSKRRRINSPYRGTLSCVPSAGVLLSRTRDADVILPLAQLVRLHAPRPLLPDPRPAAVGPAQPAGDPAAASVERYFALGGGGRPRWRSDAAHKPSVRRRARARGQRLGRLVLRRYRASPARVDERQRPIGRRAVRLPPFRSAPHLPLCC
jgi:hypothetical protein